MSPTTIGQRAKGNGTITSIGEVGRSINELTTPITAEQYRAWEEDGHIGNMLMTLAIPFLPAAILLGAAVDRADEAVASPTTADRTDG